MTYLNFSIISTSDNCCAAIAEHKTIYKTFVLLFNKYPGKEKIIVRLGYMMGNLVAKLDQARIDVSNFDELSHILILIRHTYYSFIMKQILLSVWLML